MSKRVFISGIYTITNKVNGKLYVGFSLDILYRFKNHKYKLRRGIHHSCSLQNAWNKYGEENFDFEVLEECEERFLASQEHYWVNMLRCYSTENGYNEKPTDPNGRLRMSEQAKQKLSALKKGVKLSQETKDRMKNASMVRDKPSQATRDKQSYAAKNRIRNFIEVWKDGVLLEVIRSYEAVERFGIVMYHYIRNDRECKGYKLKKH